MCAVKRLNSSLILCGLPFRFARKFLELLTWRDHPEIKSQVEQTWKTFAINTERIRLNFLLMPSTTVLIRLVTQHAKSNSTRYKNHPTLYHSEKAYFKNWFFLLLRFATRFGPKGFSRLICFYWIEKRLMAKAKLPKQDRINFSLVASRNKNAQN